MGYRQGSSDHGRGRGIPRHEKAKARRRKNQPRNAYVQEETTAVTSREVVDRTVNSLRNLGKQVFALSPFSEHFDRWLTDVKVVLSEFESSTSTNVDDYYVKERSEILSRAELELAEIKSMETLAEEAAQKLPESNILLKQIEKEYAAKTKRTKERKSSEIKRLANNVDRLEEELKAISEMETGIFRGLSKKAKAQKEADATKRLNQAEDELTSAEQGFSDQQKRLDEEYEKKKQPVVSQVEEQQKKVDRIEVDNSLETREATCERLIDVLNRLVQRNLTIQ